MITYLASRVGKPEETCDLCIIGGGAAGCELAYNLRKSGLSVVIVESGFLQFDWETQRLCQFEQVGHSIRTADYSNPFGIEEVSIQECRCRAFGGTLHVWGRRWMKRNAIDFVQRPGVEYTDWPITLEDINPYYDALIDEYQLPEFNFFDEIRTDLNLATLSCPEIEQYPFIKQKYPSQLILNYYSFFERVENMKVILGANVSNIRLSKDHGRVESIEVRSLQGHECRVKAKTFVLATGSIENARLLLCCNSQVKEGIGNHSGWLGRNFIDHLKTVIGKFTLFSPDKPFPEGNVYDASGNGLGFNISLKPELLFKFGLPDHAMIFLNDSQYPQEVPGTYFAGVFCEQWPNRDSRMTLSTEKDVLGMPKARVDWKITDRDREDYKKFLKMIGGYLQEHKVGRLTLDEGADVFDNLGDSSHQMGTTRMAKKPSEGVVDSNSKVFGIDNLYVIGSSVFPTTGNANPTFTILAMARRLADHLHP